MKYYDLIIRNGNVISFGDDKTSDKVDIGIIDGKIAKISNIDEGLQCKNVIDASGLVVSPGFIDFHSHVDCNIRVAKQMVLQGATTTIGGERNFEGKLINEIADKGFIINHGFFLSHSFTLRNAIGLTNSHISASKKEIDKMLQLAELFFKFGIFGIYFGLEMVPGTSKEEILALSELAKNHNKKILIHIRKDGIESINSVKEAIDIARASKVSLHILHLMYMAGHPELMTKCLKLISDAIDEGIDITADTGVYEAFPTYIGSSILDGDWEKHYNKIITYRDILISSGIHNGEFCSPKAFERLRSESPNTLVTIFAFDEKSSEIALKEPYIYVSTNAGDGPVYEGIGHPESAGTFPKFIRKYVRQNNILPLKDAIYKITLGPAKSFGIPGKGDIKEGYDADIVIFDYDKIFDTAKFSNVGKPDSPPVGIKNVIVNGKIVVEDGKLTENINEGKLLTARA